MRHTLIFSISDGKLNSLVLYLVEMSMDPVPDPERSLDSDPDPDLPK